MTTIGSTPETTTVYGMPADRAADEVHARSHPLRQPPRGLLQFAFSNQRELSNVA